MQDSMTKYIQALNDCYDNPQCAFVNMTRDEVIEQVADDMYSACNVISLVALVHRLSQGWISVEDRLPKESGLYLVYAWWHEWNTNDILKGTLIRLFEDNKFWSTANINITHWMPLPDPPKVSDC